MELKEFSGANVDAATEKAEAYFGLSRDELKIKVVADEKSGIYRVGLEHRAVIVARPTPEAAPRARIQAAPPSSERPREAPSRAPRGRRERAAAPEEAAEEALYTPQRKADMGPSSPAGPRTEASDRARDMLAGILSRFPLEGEIEVVGGETPDAIELSVRSDSHGLLIGEGGQVLAALTYLVNRMANKEARHSKRVVIEAEGFRSDRVASLEKLARDMADKVRATGEPARLDPMNSYDRRIVHLSLRGVPDVSTESVGEGSYKALVIRPAEKS